MLSHIFFLRLQHHLFRKVIHSSTVSLPTAKQLWPTESTSFLKRTDSPDTEQHHTLYLCRLIIGRTDSNIPLTTLSDSIMVVCKTYNWAQSACNPTPVKDYYGLFIMTNLKSNLVTLLPYLPGLLVPTDPSQRTHNLTDGNQWPRHKCKVFTVLFYCVTFVFSTLSGFFSFCFPFFFFNGKKKPKDAHRYEALTFMSHRI